MITRLFGMAMDEDADLKANKKRNSGTAVAFRPTGSPPAPRTPSSLLILSTLMNLFHQSHPSHFGPISDSPPTLPEAPLGPRAVSNLFILKRPVRPPTGCWGIPTVTADAVG